MVNKSKLNKVDEHELENVTGGAYIYTMENSPFQYHCKGNKTKFCGLCGHVHDWEWDKKASSRIKVWDCDLGIIPEDDNGNPPIRFN